MPLLILWLHHVAFLLFFALAYTMLCSWSEARPSTSLSLRLTGEVTCPLTPSALAACLAFVLPVACMISWSVQSREVVGCGVELLETVSIAEDQGDVLLPVGHDQMGYEQSALIRAKLLGLSQDLANRWKDMQRANFGLFVDGLDCAAMFQVVATTPELLLYHDGLVLQMGR